MRLVGIMQHRGVELHELHIGYCSLGTVHHGDTVASGNDGVGGRQIDCATATCTHHRHLREISINLLRIGIEHVGPIAVDIRGTTCDLGAQMVLGDDLHSEVVLLDDDIGIASYSLHQSTLYLSACVIGMVENTELGVSALAVKVEGAIFFLVEVHAPIDEFLYLFGSLAHHLLYRLTVGDVVAGNHRVLDMLVEIVEFKVSDTGHAALCKRGVGLVESCLTDHTHFAFLGARHLQSVAHTSHSCTNHEEVVFVYHILICCYYLVQR